MKNYTFYKIFATGTIDGMLIREDKKIDADKAEYFDHGRRPDCKYHQVVSLQRIINTGNNIKDHIDVRDNNMTVGKIVKGIDEAVFDYLCKKEYKPSFGDNIDYSYEFTMPFTDRINKMLLILKWVAGIQSINRKPNVTITDKDLSKIGLTISPLQLHKAIKEYFKDAVFSKNQYNWDTKELVLSVGGRDLTVSDGPGYVKLKSTQYIGLLDMIMNHHKELQLVKSDI